MSDTREAAAGAADTASLVAVLSTTSFGAHLPPDGQVRLARLARRYQAPAGTVLLAEGEPANELGVIVGGRVALRTPVPDHGMTTILTLEPGDVFGVSALVPPYRMTHSCVAVQPVDVIALDGPRLRAALASDCETAAILYTRLLQAMTRRLGATRLQLLDLYASRPDGLPQLPSRAGSAPAESRP